jgi:Pyruvate/2-oxoacid:ferredoxin oxidoreductase delta subunit
MDSCRYKALYIYYISGTGNARISSLWIAEEARKKGLDVFIQRIDRLENIVFPPAGDKIILGFAFPTHGFNAAPIMLRFISGFPRGNGRNVFLLNTRAGMKLYKFFMPGLSGVALMLPAFILWLKGYRCTGFRPVDLPSNWISLHPGLKEKVIESIFRRCEKIVRNFTHKILSGRKVWKGLYTIPVDLLLIPLALGYYLGGRYFLAKTFIANNNCNNCGLCIKECPTSSITLVQDRPYWKLTCESCMRCLNSCPCNAIETAHGMAVAFWFIFTSVNARIALLIISCFGIRSDVWWWLLLKNLGSIAILVIIVTSLYLVMHYAMFFKPVRSLIRFTSLTALPFWRRYRYPEKKARESLRTEKDTAETGKKEYGEDTLSDTAMHH